MSFLTQSALALLKSDPPVMMLSLQKSRRAESSPRAKSSFEGGRDREGLGRVHGHAREGEGENADHECESSHAWTKNELSFQKKRRLYILRVREGVKNSIHEGSSPVLSPGN